MEQNTLKSRWEKLNGTRGAVLRRARQCATLTIPSLLPPQGATQDTVLPTPWQGLGARGTNNLGSKLLLAMFPPNSPFFRIKIDDKTLAQLSQNADAKTQAEDGLAKMERSIMDEIEGMALRVSAFEALKHLIVTGNSLVFLDGEAGMRVFRLDQYCVKRDPMGNVLEIVTKESISVLLLPDSVRAVIGEKKKPEDTVELYTRVERTKTGWKVAQEAGDVPVPEANGTYPLDRCPWIPLRWSAIMGEDYGRGLIEEYLGDLNSLEVLSQAVVEGAAAAAKLLMMVNPNGTTNAKKVADAANLDVIEGNAEDVTCLQADKFADFQVAKAMIEDLKRDLSFAFMLNTSVQRDGERVTAEEIRYMAQELEDSLGGVYSVLAREFQLPLINVIRAEMERTGKLPKLPKKMAKLVITTGLEALGRTHELQKLNTFMQELEPIKEAAQEYLNIGNYMTRVGTGVGLDTAGLVLSEEDVQAARAQAQQQAQMMELAKTPAAGQVARGVMDGMKEGKIPSPAIAGAQ